MVELENYFLKFVRHTWRCYMPEKDTILTPEMDEELSNGKGDDEDE